MIHAIPSPAGTKAESLRHISTSPALPGSIVLQYLLSAFSVPAHQVPHPI